MSQLLVLLLATQGDHNKVKKRASTTKNKKSKKDQQQQQQQGSPKKKLKRTAVKTVGATTTHSKKPRFSKAGEPNNSTGYRGVSQKGNKYQAAIRVDAKQLYLGSYFCAKLAAEAYDIAIIKYNRSRNLLNFPVTSSSTVDTGHDAVGKAKGRAGTTETQGTGRGTPKTAAGTKRKNLSKGKVLVPKKIKKVKKVKKQLKKEPIQQVTFKFVTMKHNSCRNHVLVG